MTAVDGPGLEIGDIDDWTAVEGGSRRLEEGMCMRVGVEVLAI